MILFNISLNNNLHLIYNLYMLQKILKKLPKYKKLIDQLYENNNRYKNVKLLNFITEKCIQF